jgi:hypothetical protein
MGARITIFVITVLLKSFSPISQIDMTKSTMLPESIPDRNLVERQRLEMAELKLRDCQARLDLEIGQRRRMEVRE